MADIITYPENGITYDADDASGYLATRLSGVYSADEDFAVTAAGELSVAVSAGQAWVRPARFKGRSIIMEQPETLTLTAADPVRARIDRIVLRYDAAARKTSLLVLEGTPDSGTPTAPEITRTALLYDLGLAAITRKAGSTAVTSADITDTRADEAVCGVMRDGVTGIPTAELLKQWKAAQAQQEADARQSAENQLTDAQQKFDTQLTSSQQTFDSQMSTMYQQSESLSAEIKKLQNGSFYTKDEADAKFGTPYTLPAATSTTLGGIKVGNNFSIAADGTISLTGENVTNALTYTPATKDAATQTAPGLMSAADKKKLDSLDSTGSIVASGTNYIRFADGTQICWKACGTWPRDGYYSFNFPVPFVDKNYAVGFTPGTSISTSNSTIDCYVYYYTQWGKDAASTATRLVIYDPYNGSAIVIGRWK